MLEKISQEIKKEVKATIAQMKDKTGEEIVEERYQKFRNIK